MTVFTSMPVAPSSTRLILSMSFHLISWISTLIFPSHLCLGLQSDLFLSGFPSKTLCTFLFSTIHAVPSWFVHTNNICWRAQIMTLLIAWLCSVSWYFLPLNSQVNYKYKHNKLHGTKSLLRN
jgi:hypothetical protein